MPEELKLQFVKFIISFSTVTVYKYSLLKFAIAEAITLGYHFCQQAKIEHIHEEHWREMEFLKMQSDKEKASLIQKIRDMREGILSEKVSLNTRILDCCINLIIPPSAWQLCDPAQCYEKCHSTFNKAVI